MMSKRNQPGHGHVYQLASGTWRGQIQDGFKPDGRRNMVSFTAKTEEQVREQIRQYRYQQELSSLYDGDVAFDKVARVWYADYQTQVQPSTYSGYRFTMDKLITYFGDRPVTEMKPFHISRFLDYLTQQQVSKSYRTKCRAMLIQIFDFAQANELVSSNPARLAKAIRVRRTAEMPGEAAVHEKDAFSCEEQELLMAQLPHTLMGNGIRCMLASGLRTQELIALCPGDITEDGSMISVTKAIQQVDGQPRLGPPKSRRGKRIVPIPEHFREAVRYLREHPEGETFIWTSQRASGLCDPNVFRDRYYRTLETIPQVRRLTPHCCRHTYVSNLERCGVPMEQIARLAGHSRVQTTDGYLHTEMATLKAAVERLGNRKGEK
jgi:integrase